MAAANQDLAETLVELERIYFANLDPDKRHQELHGRVRRLASKLQPRTEGDLHQITEVVDRIIEEARGIVDQAFSLQVVQFPKQLRIASGLYIFMEVMTTQMLDKVKRINTKWQTQLDKITEETFVSQEHNEPETSEDSSPQGDWSNWGAQSSGGSSPPGPSLGGSPPPPSEAEHWPEPHELFPPGQPHPRRTSLPARLPSETTQGEAGRTPPHQPASEVDDEPAGPSDPTGRRTRVIVNPPNYTGMTVPSPRPRTRPRPDNQNNQGDPSATVQPPA